jgi:hypothetical protein
MSGSVLPETLEPVGRQVCINDRVADVPVPEVMLDGPSILAVVGEFVTGGVPQHVRVDGKRVDAELGERAVEIPGEGKAAAFNPIEFNWIRTGVVQLMIPTAIARNCKVAWRSTVSNSGTPAWNNALI